FRSLRLYRRKYLIITAAMILIPIAVHAIPMAFSSDLPIVDRVRDPKTSESTGLRLAFGFVAFEMFKARPLLGVGADNYGQRFDRYLQIYAAEHSTDTNLTGTELGMAERAHNEYLQILSELGIIGFVLFVAFLGGITKLIYDALRSGRRLRIQTIGAILGLVCFLFSSLISSYSFRVTQNGLMFFLVLAIVISRISPKKKVTNIVEVRPHLRSFRLSFAVSSALCLFFLLFGSVRVLSVHFVNMASAAQTIDDALPLYKTAMKLDPENANAYTAAGSYLISAGRSDEASINFQKAIALGRCLPADYSFLATSQIVSGQLEMAEETLTRGATAYPFSIFLSTRRAVVLKDLGRLGESDAAFANALRVDRGEAKTWWNLVDSGGRVASQIAFDDKLPTVMELRPESAVFAAIADREIRFPEERPKFGF
ncbi:MAG: O-antigen ligase family protein, partial [Acidobacteriota bacterium]